jgi:DegV family protein with EDD domain
MQETQSVLQTIAVVTDSATGIPARLLERYRISVVPLWVRIGNQAYRDGVDITSKELFAKLRAPTPPEVSTSIPPVEAFLEVYRQVSEWAQGIVSVHIAGEQSGTCGAARLASEGSPVPVVVVDSGSTAMAEGFVVLEAARKALSGASLEEVASRARSIVPRVELLALLESVTYAIKGGRLASAARLLGNFLNIQPLVRVGRNRVDLVGQVRRRSKGLAQLIERVKKTAHNLPTYIAVHYAEDEEEGQTVLEELKSQLNCVEAYLTRVPVALGVHAGPGALGVAVYVEGEEER